MIFRRQSHFPELMNLLAAGSLLYPAMRIHRVKEPYVILSTL
ncbi:uncharacterized protein G2W53_002755 [Senna tora]|uniref:Uncharacterized protein n=1 Tax=Senna tora TaxID=362788 RepID=A0A834X9Z3_9FABA|nr:uncharacterized protein G2W53_002755 [Senna tora]